MGQCPSSTFINDLGQLSHFEEFVLLAELSAAFGGNFVEFRWALLNHDAK